MAKDRMVWQVYLTDKDREVAEKLTDFYYLDRDKPAQAVKMALRHELERLIFMQEEKRREEAREEPNAESSSQDQKRL